MICFALVSVAQAYFKLVSQTVLDIFERYPAVAQNVLVKSCMSSILSINFTCLLEAVPSEKPFLKGSFPATEKVLFQKYVSTNSIII